MSANNYINIDTKTFEVEHRDADSHLTYGKPKIAKTLEEAIKLAEEMCEEESPVEHGYMFDMPRKK